MKIFSGSVQLRILELRVRRGGTGSTICGSVMDSVYAWQYSDSSNDG